MKRFYFLFVFLFVLFPVFAQDADRTLTDSGDVPELVATYGDGTLLGVADFLDDETLVAGATFGVWLYDLTKLNELQAGETLPRRLLEHPGGVTDIRFNADHSRMVTMAWGTARLWDMSDESLIAEIPAYDTASLSADGDYLLAGDGTNRVNIWRLDDLSAPITAVETGGTQPSAIQFSLDGQLVAIAGTSMDVCPHRYYTRIDVYAAADLLTGNDPLYSLETDQLDAPFAFSPDNTMLVYSPYTQPEPLPGIYEGSTFTVSYQDEPVADLPSVVAVDARTGEPRHTLLPEFLNSDVLLYQPDGSLLMHVAPRRGGPPNWWRWDGEGQPEFVDETGNFHIFSTTRMSPDGQYLVYGEWWQVTLTDAATMRSIRNFFDEKEVEGDWIFTPAPLTITRMEGEAILAQMNALDGDLLVSADAAVSVEHMQGNPGSFGTFDTIFAFHDADGPRVTITISAPEMPGAVALNADGRYFAASTGGVGCGTAAERVRIWDTKTGEALYEKPGLADQITLHPHLPLMVLADDEWLTLLNWQSGETVTMWRAGPMSVTQAAFSADGALLFTYSLDGTIRAWKIED